MSNSVCYGVTSRLPGPAVGNGRVGELSSEGIQRMPEIVAFWSRNEGLSSTTPTPAGSRHEVQFPVPGTRVGLSSGAGNESSTSPCVPSADSLNVADRPGGMANRWVTPPV